MQWRGGVTNWRARACGWWRSEGGGFLTADGVIWSSNSPHLLLLHHHLFPFGRHVVCAGHVCDGATAFAPRGRDNAPRDGSAREPARDRRASLCAPLCRRRLVDRLFLLLSAVPTAVWIPPAHPIACDPSAGPGDRRAAANVAFPTRGEEVGVQRAPVAQPAAGAASVHGGRKHHVVSARPAGDGALYIVPRHPRDGGGGGGVGTGSSGCGECVGQGKDGGWRSAGEEAVEMAPAVRLCAGGAVCCDGGVGRGGNDVGEQERLDGSDAVGGRSTRTGRGGPRHPHPEKQTTQAVRHTTDARNTTFANRARY
ncbi:hypothetical protein L1887_51541 [Cichorium endivia]|nr:hypothetical protein L1887_51541 [Cichorium endivia]